MSPLKATNEEIRHRLQQERRRREERRQATLPIRTIDALLAELEDLHLHDRKRVPESFDARLDALLAMLPPDCRLELRSRITIAHLMDRLYAIQDRLLSRRSTARERRDDATADDPLPRAS